MSNKSIRRSLSMTPEMAQRLKQITSTKPRNITEADLIREAIRRFLDEQEAQKFSLVSQQPKQEKDSSNTWMWIVGILLLVVGL